MEPKIQQELQQLVHNAQQYFQQGIDSIQKGLFKKSSFFFNLSARENDKISELLKGLING